MEKVTLNVEFLFALNSKREWINRVPAILPDKKNKAEAWVWIDVNGNTLAIGEDFAAAEKMESYPVKVYRKIRVAEAILNIEFCDCLTPINIKHYGHCNNCGRKFHKSYK